MQAMTCKNCHMSLHRAMLLAMLEDAGAKVYPNALHCTEDKEHNFVPNKPADAIDIFDPKDNGNQGS